MNGKLDWTIGAFLWSRYRNHIRGYRDNNLDGEIMYECSSPLANPASCYDHDYLCMMSQVTVGFITDSKVERLNSLYGQTTYRTIVIVENSVWPKIYEDTFTTDVTNFFNVERISLKQDGTSDKWTGKAVMEFDLDDDTMTYFLFQGALSLVEVILHLDLQMTMLHQW